MCLSANAAFFFPFLYSQNYRGIKIQLKDSDNKKQPCGAFPAGRQSTTLVYWQTARWSNERSNQNPSVPRCKEEEIRSCCIWTLLASQTPVALRSGTAYLIRILPPLLPFVGVVGGNGQITDGGVEPHVENLPT